VSYSRAQLFELSKKVGRSWRTLQYWAAQGCDLNDPASLEAFLQAKELRKTNVQKSRERRGRVRDRGPVRFRRDKESHNVTFSNGPQTGSDLRGNGDLGPIGKKGAAAALERLEASEERAHARLEAALTRGNPVEIAAAQDFWLKCSETLRRLDLAVETARREAETQVPLRVAQDATTFAAEWMRIAFMQFLSSEGVALMGIRDFGEWKAYAVDRFRGILNLTVSNADRTNSAIPDWAKSRIKTAWNVET
jgi:hypothetical protein